MMGQMARIFPGLFYFESRIQPGRRSANMFKELLNE